MTQQPPTARNSDETHPGARETAFADGNVRVTVIDADTGEIIDQHSAHNATSVDYHELAVRSLDPSTVEQRLITDLEVGRGDADPAPSQRSLVDSIGTTSADSTYCQGRTIYVDSQIGTGEFNGETIREIGLRAGPRLINRALINATPKTPGNVITVETTLTLGNDPGVTVDGGV